MSLGNVRVTVVYLAQAREFAGTKEDKFVLQSPVDLEHLFYEVVDAHPKLQEIREIIHTLVNGRMALGNLQLKDGDRVVLLPPVGGG